MGAVASRVIDIVPKAVKDAVISVFGTSDKTFLAVMMTLIMWSTAALVLRNQQHRARNATIAVLVLGGLGAVSVGASASGQAAVFISALAAAVGFIILGSIEHPALASETVDPSAQRAEPMIRSRWDAPVDRRAFVTRVGTISAASGAFALGSRVSSSSNDAEQLRRASRRFPNVRGGPDAAPQIPPEASVGGGVEPFITPAKSFYRIDTVPFSSPRVDLSTWRLKISGAVKKPLSLSYEDLLDRHVVERVVTLCCVSNEVGGDLIGTAKWLGVPLAELLEEAQPTGGAEQVAMTSVDGWTCGFPYELAIDGRDAMVAIGMNGAPLPIDHGFPARVVVPGLYGYVSATKWVSEISLTGWDDFDGYWIPRGWAKEAPIKTQSRIDVPRSGESVLAGPTVIAGIAWAQHRGIERVEVRIDNGEWMPATLGSDVTDDAWRQWKFDWQATPGDHLITVRATDKTGSTQTEASAPPDPDGATGWHTRAVTVS
jgi:DMSO/TMAO reductase YedYZ molybdopterin-dependent catalytic subunit